MLPQDRPVSTFFDGKSCNQTCLAFAQASPRLP